MTRDRCGRPLTSVAAAAEICDENETVAMIDDVAHIHFRLMPEHVSDAPLACLRYVAAD